MSFVRGTWANRLSGGGLSGVTEDGMTPNVVTVADALNVGTTTDAVAAGDFSAGLTGASRLTFDQSARELTIHDSSGNADVTLSESGGNAVMTAALQVILNAPSGGVLQGNNNNALYWLGADALAGTNAVSKLGDPTNRWASGHFGPNGLIVYDSSGNDTNTLTTNSNGYLLLNSSQTGYTCAIRTRGYASPLADGQLWISGQPFIKNPILGLENKYGNGSAKLELTTTQLEINGPGRIKLGGIAIARDNLSALYPASSGKDLGHSTQPWAKLLVTEINMGATNALNTKILTDSGTPEGSKTAHVGSLYLRTDGGASTSLYVKESGNGNTGWSALGADTVVESTNDGRLSVHSTDPLGEGSSSSILYLHRYTGSRMALYDGSSEWSYLTIADTPLQVATTGVATASKPYDVFAYDNSGTIAMELTAWTDDTTRATALTRQDGVLVKSGATTRRYLGTVYLDASKQVTDSGKLRHLQNWENRVPWESNDTVTPILGANWSSNLQWEVVSCLDSSALLRAQMQACFQLNNAAEAAIAIALDWTSGAPSNPPAVSARKDSAQVAYIPPTAVFSQDLTAGYHTLDGISVAVQGTPSNYTNAYMTVSGVR